MLFDRFAMEEQFGWRVEQCCYRVLETSDRKACATSRHQRFKEQVKANPTATTSAPCSRRRWRTEFQRMADTDLAKRRNRHFTAATST